MTAVEQIFDALNRLSPDEQADFARRFEELQAQSWDAQVAADASAGRLDWLAREAQLDHESGRCTER
ncbi:MAG: hypothetical protein ACRCT8_16295 [Lacipirellulaceae bacterium]